MTAVDVLFPDDEVTEVNPLKPSDWLGGCVVDGCNHGDCEAAAREERRREIAEDRRAKASAEAEQQEQGDNTPVEQGRDSWGLTP